MTWRCPHCTVLSYVTHEHCDRCGAPKPPPPKEEPKKK